MTFNGAMSDEVVEAFLDLAESLDYLRVTKSGAVVVWGPTHSLV